MNRLRRDTCGHCRTDPDAVLDSPFIVDGPMPAQTLAMADILQDLVAVWDDPASTANDIRESHSRAVSQARVLLPSIRRPAPTAGGERPRRSTDGHGGTGTANSHGGR